LRVYRDQTAPVIEWYRANGKPVLAVNAVGSPGDVTERVVRALPK
jgi:adenylate kinase family enzyme